MDYKKDLADKLPQLKKLEGFPIGKDEDILALSQPPYYTAVPTPILKILSKNMENLMMKKRIPIQESRLLGT